MNTEPIKTKGNAGRTRVTILIADDHGLVRDGLRSILGATDGIEVVGEATNGREAVALARELEPHIVLMDINMPGMNGLDATRQIKALRPTTRVIAVSMHADKMTTMRMLEAGASAFVVKTARASDLVRAISVVMDGKTFLSPDVAGFVIETSIRPADANARNGTRDLTARERQVLQLVAEGQTSKQIASFLHISVKTTETHRRNIMTKLEIHTVAGLTKFAIRGGITGLER